MDFPAYEESWLDALMRCDADPFAATAELSAYGRLAPGWALHRPAGVRVHLLWLVVAGSCTGRVAGRPVVLAPGTALWVPACTGFALRAVGATDPRPGAAAASPAAYRIGLALPDCPRRVGPFLLADNAWELRPLLDALIRDLDTRPPLAALRSRSLLVAVLATLLRGASEPRQSGATTPLSRAQRAALESYADEHAGERPPVRELAAAVGLPEPLFRQRFRMAYGRSARSWLLHRRIHAAARILDDAEGASVGAVARRFGYADVFLFSRQFKAVMGMSPRAWRERGQRPPGPPRSPAGRQAE